MKRYVRLALSRRLMNRMAGWTAEIKRCRKPETRYERARELWTSKRSNVEFQEALAKLVEMNAGLLHCMYCEADRGAIKKGSRYSAIVEHWRPKHVEPLGTFEWNNLFLACGVCNSFLKGADFPVDPTTGDPQLLHPVDDDPYAALTFSPTTGAYTAPVGSKGDTTIAFFHLPTLDHQRFGALEGYKSLIRLYDAKARGGDPVEAERIRAILLSLSFRSVLHRMFDLACAPAGPVLLGQDVVDAINAHAMRSWV